MKVPVSIGVLLIIASLLSLAGVPSNPITGIPWSIHSAHANDAVNEHWYPAGPSEDTLTMSIFDGPQKELANIIGSPEIDLTDTAGDPSQFPGPNYLVTQQPVIRGFYDIEFNLGYSNFWGCDMAFGQSQCGRDIRQGIAHLIDKNEFARVELAGLGSAIDNPVAPNEGLPSPNPCGWDPLYGETGSGCQVVNGIAGGVAYHLQSSTVPGVACPNSSFPPYSYMPQCGTPDFCAAADHFIRAGIASGKDPTTCVLTLPVSPFVTTSHSTAPPFFIRSDDPTLRRLGETLTLEICALLNNGIFHYDSEQTCYGQLNEVEGVLTSFPGWDTTAVSSRWAMYTGGVGSQLLPGALDGAHKPAWWNDPFDINLFYSYNSQLASGLSSVQPPNGPCSSSSIPTPGAANYIWLCSPDYDTYSRNMEFAPCVSALGDPSGGQIVPTFANCPGTNSPSAISAGYQSEDWFGRNAFAIPIYYLNEQFGYLNGWSRVVNGAGGIANFFTYLDAYSTQSSTIRQGISSPGYSLNPFWSLTYQDSQVLDQIYDSLGRTNPNYPSDYMDWMTVSTAPILTAALGYAAPAGTVQAFRYTLRNDIFFQTGQKVTAWDVAFSYIAYRDVGVMPGLDPVTGIKVLSPTQIDLDVNAVGPFTEMYLSHPVIPGRDWVSSSACTASAWDVAANNPNFAAANGVLTACIAPSGFVTGSGVITPGLGGSNIDGGKIVSTYHPSSSASSNFIGSGPWLCTSSTTFPPAGSAIGWGCSSTGLEAPPASGSYTLQRFGRGTVPGGSLSGTYFRSSGNLALWVWSQDRGTFSTDFLNFGQVALCFSKAVGTAGCTVWQHGIGGSASGTAIGITQVSIVQRFVGVNWISPYNWVTSPPTGIAAFPPVLYEGSVTLNPCNVDAVNGYDC